ncbi:uncharacterized protein L969DRAFT_102252 [Mixia osmundae IAM 14324]|uniref:CBM1 domain-containing protein n=1 Tax=Mixia osmundae (strain CBS 9802 / IAM 14324 / JCM 22182 / KY 12970) TaxID=764103 RepID=G7E5F4_MIXOS|nr:uncharacterized protein L969DRAFT_102252 [Mixia osmundae IAM 14324]KEI40785.1 hypothetical protein L969DRAFT_102252 [Mixia osmundae IAM 14324]GAA98064.1 hypothetical protein E5Q_04745 [Mixia osmundae IAM 14324]
MFKTILVLSLCALFVATNSQIADDDGFMGHCVGGPYNGEPCGDAQSDCSDRSTGYLIPGVSCPSD